MFVKKIKYINNQKDYKEKFYILKSHYEELYKINLQMGENFTLCRKENEVLKKENERLIRNNKSLDEYVDRLLNIIDDTYIGKVIDENIELKHMLYKLKEVMYDL